VQLISPSLHKIYRFVTMAINITITIMDIEVEVTLRLTASQSVCLAFEHPFGAYGWIFLFPFLCRKIALLFVLGRPLWREDGSVIYSAICQWPESRRTHSHTLLSHLRLLDSLSVASYDSQGLRWKYPSSCLLFKAQFNSLGFSIPHRKHIKSPLQAQQVNAIYRFVTMVY
jgi:hypothetical protein